MKTSELITLLRNLINSLNSERATAFASGQVARVLEIDAKIVETQTTIDQIEGLQQE